MENIEGVIEHKSSFGVKINGVWYNESPEHKGILDSYNKGDSVRLEYYTKGKWRNVTAAQLKGTKNSDDYSETKDDNEERIISNKEFKQKILQNAQRMTTGPIIGMAINNAAEYVLKYGDSKGKPLPHDIWASEVIKYAQALLKEMENNGL